MKRRNWGAVLSGAFLPITVILVVKHCYDWFSTPLDGWAITAAIASLIELGLCIALFIELGGIPARNRERDVSSQANGTPHEPQTAIRLLKLILPSDETQPIIIGDLLEEFDHIYSKPKAYLWLFSQAFRSIPPLIYARVKSQLASYLGKWIR